MPTPVLLNPNHPKKGSSIKVEPVKDLNSPDIYRPAAEGEFDLVPDCRKRGVENPIYFEGCVKRIFPVHS